MTNRTQCPNCLTVYIITDEQYRKSKGKVRCGTCRQPFVATFLPDEEAESNQHDKPSIEEQSPKTSPPTTPLPPSLAEAGGIGRHASSEQKEPVPDAGNTQRSLGFGDGNDFSRDEESPSKVVDVEPSNSLNTSVEQSGNDSTNDLISEMDSLIDEKLAESDQDQSISDVESAQTDDDLFTLTSKPPRSALSRWLLTPLLCLISLTLLLLLIWQLWLRQSLPWLDQWLDRAQLTAQVTPYFEQFRRELDARFNWQLPERRDLSNLRLVSARVEPHPARPSTTLLKVSLINRSPIAQPFPWLELVLTDVDGRLVSRRTLSPVDYLHNNRINNLIRTNELRPVTIELLAFPRQAHGYELKIIER